MSLTLAFHWVRVSPSKGCGVNLCHFVTLAGRGQGKHSIGKYGVREVFVSQHWVICQEAAGKRWIETGPHPELSGGVMTTVRLARSREITHWAAKVCGSIGTILCN